MPISRAQLTPRQAVHHQFAYRPYVGGAGPLPQQRDECLAALRAGLRQHRIAFLEGKDEQGEPYVALHGCRVFYDRWGFVAEHSPTSNHHKACERIDQSDLYDTLVWCGAAL